MIFDGEENRTTKRALRRGPSEINMNPVGGKR